MKLNKYVVLTIGSAAALLAYDMSKNFRATNGGSFEFSSSRAPASFEDVVAYVKQHISPNTQVFANVQGMLAKMIQDHNASEVKAGKIVIMNNIGTSDSDYADKDGLKTMAQNEVKAIANSMGQNGGTIVVGAGNTNTGVGRYITALQDANFLAEMKGMGVRIVFFGISSDQAALNHGSYDDGKYGTDFMNTNLDYSTLLEDPNQDWKVIRDGISQVVEFSIEAVKEAAKQGKVTESILVGREGGAIGMGELTQYLFELQRQAEKSGLPLETLAQYSKMKLQVGLASGTAAGEIAANKGPKAATDLLIALDRMVDASPDLADIVFKTKISVEVFADGAAAPTKTVTLNSEADLKQVVADALALEKETLELAKEYNAKLKEGKSASQIDTEMGILDKATIKQLGKDLKTAEGQQKTEIVAKLDKSLKAIRAREFRNSVLTTATAAQDLAKVYGKAGIRRSKVLSGMLSEAVISMAKNSKNALAINKTTGVVERAEVKRVAKAVEAAKRR